MTYIFDDPKKGFRIDKGKFKFSCTHPIFRCVVSESENVHGLNKIRSRDQLASGGSGQEPFVVGSPDVDAYEDWVLAEIGIVAEFEKSNISIK